MPQASKVHNVLDLAPALLSWYDDHARDLPWRHQGGAHPDPWHVLLSEIMLQQTTVATVTPRFQTFIGRWPTPVDMANTDREDILAEWAGLGYYARARNLHKCAVTIRDQYNGSIPDTEEALLSLPGIGAYTAAAIAAIGFGRRAVVVDGNVERVVSRLFSITEPLPGSKKQIRHHCDQITPQERSGDFAQAMMDLASSLCKPKNPACTACPLQNNCSALTQGIAGDLPKKAAKKAKPTRQGIAWVLRNDQDQVLLVQRPDKGLLGGMMAFPSSDWQESLPGHNELAVQAPANTEWTPIDATVTHVFTHFKLELRIACATATPTGTTNGLWTAITDLEKAGLPTVMKKVAIAAGLLP